MVIPKSSNRWRRASSVTEVGIHLIVRSDYCTAWCERATCSGINGDTFDTLLFSRRPMLIRYRRSTRARERESVDPYTPTTLTSQFHKARLKSKPQSRPLQQQPKTLNISKERFGSSWFQHDEPSDHGDSDYGPTTGQFQPENFSSMKWWLVR
jgi:hypothetical protein